MSTRTRRPLRLPETFAFTTIGVFTVASFACGTSGTGTSSSSTSASSSTGMGGASSSSSSSSSGTSSASIASSSSGSSTCTPDGGMCVVPDGGNQQTIFGCIDFGVPDAGCPTGLVCMSSDCPMSCEPLLYIYCPGDAGCQPSNNVFGCAPGADAGSTPCPSNYVCSADDCPAGCIGEPIA